MSLLDYPKEACPACKNSDWYYRNGPPGWWECIKCHAPGDPVELLKARAILANRKLYLAWFQLTDGAGGQLNEEGKDIYAEATQRARDIARQLKELSKTECLYIENGKKLKKCNVMPVLTDKPSWNGFFCHCCPNDYWWEKELFELDEEKIKREERLKRGG